MDIKITPGIKHHEEIISNKKHCALAFGSGSVNVFATPAMIALLEKTAHDSIQPLLPAGYTTVGTEVNIKHLKATAIGKKVRSDSYLKSVDGKKLFFELHAWDDKGMIGIGTHTRVIVDEKSFMEKIM
jgi:fluoroacetyl-CoA thioesterase